MRPGSVPGPLYFTATALCLGRKKSENSLQHNRVTTCSAYVSAHSGSRRNRLEMALWTESQDLSHSAATDVTKEVTLSLLEGGEELISDSVHPARMRAK